MSETVISADTTETADVTVSIPPERVQELRKAIHAHLASSNVYSQIRSIIDAYAADHAGPDFNPNNPDDVLRVIQERGLVQQILSRMAGGAGATNANRSAATATRNILRGLKPNEKYLHVRLLGGRAFIDNLDLDVQSQKNSQMVCCAHYGTQRFRSSPQEALVDPCFDDDFLIHLDHGHAEIVDLATPLHICVVKEDCSLGRVRFIGENTIEWRKVLRTGYMSLTVELCGDNPSIPSGIVEMEIELIPGGAKWPEEDISERITTQRNAVMAADREFLIYARRWWAEFHAIRSSHESRQVKVFAATASGRMVPVTHFISVIGPDRTLESPQSAARFVALLQLQRAEDATRDLLTGGSRTGNSGAGDIWPSQFVFLSQRHGDICSHATLLCSLLLGFGLDAYCIVGTEGPQLKAHMWVMTRRRLTSTDFEITYWESTTGQRVAPNGTHEYISVGCAFNHLSFYANTQESDNAVTTLFNFEDEVQWKSLQTLKLRMVPKFPNPPLLYIPMNLRLMETELEARLKKLVEGHRDTLGLQTHWDEALAAVTAQALVVYEQQRTAGGGLADRSSLTSQVGADMSIFQACVKGTIGEGRSFKGFPLNVTHVGERRILSLVLGAASGKELLELVGDDLRHSVRVRCTAFPESVISVWIMFAARYRPLL